MKLQTLQEVVNSLCYSYINCLDLKNWKVTVRDTNIKGKTIGLVQKLHIFYSLSTSILVLGVTNITATT